MASGKVENKYTCVDDHIEIEAGGSIINIDFNSAKDLFNSIKNSGAVKSAETQQEILAGLNENILYVYNMIINGSSYLSGIMSKKQKYSKKISKLLEVIKREICAEYWIELKNDKNYKEKSLSSVIKNLGGNAKNNIENGTSISNFVKKYYASYLNDYTKTHKGEDISGFYDYIKNIGSYGCSIYGKFDDYINKKSYIQFAENADQNPFNAFSDLTAIETSKQFILNGEHCKINHFGFIPSEALVRSWAEDLNKDLKSSNLQIDVAVLNRYISALKKKETPRENSEFIISTKGTGNALNQIFVDFEQNRVSSAFNKHFDFNTGNVKESENNFIIDNKVFKNNDFFNTGLGSVKLTSAGNILKYIAKCLNNCFKQMKTAEANNAENIMQYFRNNVNDGFRGPKETFQEFLDVDNYYDFYSTMSPRIKLTFRYKTSDGKDEKCTIDNTRYSFIKSMSMEDNGAKKFKIVLYDRDFNTPIKEKVNDGYKNYGSLDKVIAKTLNLNTNNKNSADRDSKNVNRYKIGSSNFGDLLGFKTADATNWNLSIEYGFNDNDGGAPSKTLTNYKVEDDGMAYAGKTRYYGGAENEKLNRNGRWWDIETEDSKTDNKTLSVRSNSSNQTTSKAKGINTIITGYKTKFTEGGIYYTIEAIEYKSITLNTYKIYQRYTNITGTPKEVLYSVMRIIKGLFSGEINIYLESDLAEEDGIYEETETITEEDEDGESTIGTKTKEISVSLGTKDALSMYRNSGAGDNKITTDFEIIKESKSKMYKSVKSLLDDLCAAMPAKLDENTATEDVVIEDEDGNSKKVNEAHKTYRRFTYVATEEKGKINITFCYQKPREFRRIRKYNWGPANSKNSVIKSVDISTENEYSLLSSMTVINYDKETGGPVKGIITRDGAYISDKGSFITKEGSKADYIYSPGDGNTEQEMALSYAQCLYSGEITILGDPFYNFNNYMMPYTYPIYLDFKIPRSEIDIIDKYSGNKTKYEKEEDVLNATPYGYSHFMSGFYVVTSIKQNISESGYTTTLGVMSYPNIIKDIIPSMYK